MAIGDDALAAGMDILTGNELANTLDTEENKTRDYIAQRTSAVTPVLKGGTGATTAAGARANLDVNSKQEVFDGLKTRVINVSSATNAIQLQWIGGRIRMIIDASNVGDIATVADLGSFISSAGGTITGSLFLPNASPAANNYAVAYINGDGRVSRGASSERYKKHISEIDPESLGDIFPALHRFQMRQGDGSWKYGWIAERLAEDADTEPFVVYNDQGTPDSIDFIALLIAQNAQLHQQLGLLAQRLAALEAHHATD